MTGIVGVDIGGSGLRLQRLCGGSPGEVRNAPGVRVGSRGIDVVALTADARALLGERAEPPEVVVWSMRGLLFLADRATVLDQVRSGLGARTTVVVSDAVASLVGAVGGIGPGAAVAAGTGAVAFGTDFDERWNRVDGWGHVLGDVGSGAWIGLAGLRAALRQHDGMGDGSAGLLAAAVERFGPAETWPRQVMTSSDAPERLAGFAPAVCELAPSDPVAARVCVQAGRGLAEALLAAARGLPSPRLVATGGVLGAAPVTDALDARLAEAGRHRSPASGSALDGALLLGQHVLETSSLPEHPAYLLVG